MDFSDLPKQERIDWRARAEIAEREVAYLLSRLRPFRKLEAIFMRDPYIKGRIRAAREFHFGDTKEAREYLEHEAGAWRGGDGQP